MTERRFLKLQDCALRAEQNGDSPQIVGHAAVFNQPTEIFGFEEVILSGAFARAIKEEQDVRALIDHDSRLILGRTKSDTLSLKEDDHGLFVTIKPPKTSFADDVLESIRRGDLDGMSFAFIPRQQNIKEEEDKTIREIADVDLIDVSVVTFPAFEGTDVELKNAGIETLELRRIILRSRRGHILSEDEIDFVKRSMDALKRLLPPVVEVGEEHLGISLLECEQHLREHSLTG